MNRLSDKKSWWKDRQEILKALDRMSKIGGNGLVDTQEVMDVKAAAYVLMTKYAYLMD